MSVVIPTRNRWPLLSRALASVLGQEDVAVEVLVVDEASTDDTPAGLAAVTDERVVCLRNDRATGVSNARNRGIAAARGEWVAFLDDDDLWAPRKLCSQLDVCEVEGADFSYTGLVTTDLTLDRRRVSSPASPLGLERTLLGMNVIGSPSSVMVRRSLLDEAGAFDPAFSILADWDLYIRIAAAGRGAVCEAPLTGYLAHVSNMHLNVSASIEEFRRLRTKHEALAASLDVRVGGLGWWGWIADAYRRSGHRFRSTALFLWAAVRFRKPDYVARAAGALAGSRLSRRVRVIWPAREDQWSGSAPEARWLEAFQAQS